MSTVNIGAKIKSVIRKKGLSVSEFGRRINTSRENVYSIFNRESIDTALLARIAEVLEHDFFSYYYSGSSNYVLESASSYGNSTKGDLNQLIKEVELLRKAFAALEKKVGKEKKVR